MQRVDEILSFWFGELTETSTPEERAPFGALWFGKDPATDAEIQERFEADLDAARSGSLRAWEESARGTLALILLYDQFPRMMYRGTPKMHAFDAKAQGTCLAGIDAGLDQQLPLHHRQFFYMPLMHSEQLPHHHTCEALFAGLVDDAKRICPGNVGVYEGVLGYAHQHRQIIEQFGRYPHRNDVLGRTCTSDEMTFLQGPDSGF